MAEDYKVVAARQSASFASSWVASRIRNRKRSIELPPELADPDRPALLAAEKMLAGQPLDPGESPRDLIDEPVLIPGDLFAQIHDREAAKFTLSAALKAKAPVHVLLVGDPASGKSDLLECIARLPHARYAVGGMTSTSGLVDYLLERPQTRFLVIDELDKARTEDFAALYSLMQSGRVPRMVHGKIEEVHRRVWVFAAANDISRLPDALKSRFVIVNCPPYSAADLRAVNQLVAEREGHSPAAAAELAERVAARSSDPRVARDVARMMAGDDGDLDQIVAHVTARKPGKTE